MGLTRLSLAVVFERLFLIGSMFTLIERSGVVRGPFALCRPSRMRRVARCDSSALGVCFGTRVPCRPICPVAPSCLDFVDMLVQIDDDSREDTWDPHVHRYHL